MSNSVVDESIDSFIADLGDSLSYWTSYLASVKRGHVLQESAIRYAISEFLEVNKHNECGSPIIKEYCFEQDHPYYKGKSSDLFYRAAFLNKDLESYFAPSEDNESATKEKEFTIEFKYVRDDARDKNGNEFKRYVKDLCRLHCISKNETDLAKCYFVVVGEYDSFYDNFCSIQKQKPGPKRKEFNQAKEETVRILTPNGQYADLLPFSPDEERTVNLGDYGFITKALKEATDKSANNPDTSFFRLSIPEINELRHNANPSKKNMETVLFIEPDEKFNVRMVYSNLYPDLQKHLHPDTLVCIWEVL